MTVVHMNSATTAHKGRTVSKFVVLEFLLRTTPHTHHTGTFFHPDTAADSALNIKIYHSHIKLKKQRVWRDKHSKQFLPVTSSLLALYPLRQLSM